MPGRVNLVRKDGTVVSVEKDKVPTLLQYGYRLEAPEEGLNRRVQAEESEHYSSTGQQLIAGAEGLASGATLGLSDIALDAAGADTSQRADYNPRLRLGTEILGALVTAIPTGGGSLEARGVAGTVKAFTPSAALSRGAGAIGEKMLGKGLAGRAVAGAVEGGVAGTSFEAARAVLADDPFTVESAVSGATLGAFFGAGAASVAHGVGGLVNKVSGRKAAAALEGLDGLGGGADDYIARTGAPSLERELAQSLEDIRLQQATPARAATELDIPAPRKYGPSKTANQVYGDVARGLVPDSEFAKVNDAISGFKTEVDRLTTEISAAHETAAKLTPDVYAMQVREATDPLLNEVMLNGTTAARNLAKTTRAQWKYVEKAVRDGDAKALETWLAKHKESSSLLAEATGSSVVWPEGVSKVSRSMEEVASLGLAAKSLKSMPKDASSFFKMAPDKAEEMFAALGKAMNAGIPEARPLQEALGRVLETMADKAGVRVEAQGADAVSRLRATYAAGREAANVAESKFFAESDAFKAKHEMTRGPQGGSDPWEPHKGGPVEPWTKRETSLGSKYKPEVDEFATSNPKAAKPKAEPESLGARVGSHMRRAAAYGTMNALVPGASLAKTALIGVLLAGKGKAVAAMESAVARIGPGFAKAAKAGTRAQPLASNLSGMPDREGDLKKSFAARSAEIRELFASGKDRAFLTAQDLSAAGHPEFAFAAYTSATRALDVLMRKLPKDPPGTRWGTESVWQAPEEQIVVFSQEYAAATKPVEFLTQALDNPSGVFPSAIEVVEEAWPAVYNNFRSQVLIRLAEVGTSKLSHQELVSLGVLIGVPLSPLMAPENIQDHLAMFAQPPPAPAAPQIIPSPPGESGETTASQRQTSLR